MRKVVISGPPPVQVLDVIGPLEVFSNVPDYQVEVVSSDGSDQLTTNRGIKLAEAVPRDSVSGPIGTLVIAGGPGSESGDYDPDYVRWIVEASGRSRRVASICTARFLTRRCRPSRS
jgi:putative intracellular protease/amidase